MKKRLGMGMQGRNRLQVERGLLVRREMLGPPLPHLLKGPALGLQDGCGLQGCGRLLVPGPGNSCRGTLRGVLPAVAMPHLHLRPERALELQDRHRLRKGRLEMVQIPVGGSQVRVQLPGGHQTGLRGRSPAIQILQARRGIRADV